MNEMIKILYLFFAIFALIILSSFVLSDIYGINEGNVALININSQISAQSSLFESSISSDLIIESLIEAENNPNVLAIILSINSPGGSAVASKEVAEHIKGMNKTVISWIREYSLSGAYLAASATDYIIADELSMVGSIGSTISYVGINGTLEKYGAEFYEISSGNLKEMGSPYKELSEEEYLILKGLVDESFEYFRDFVVESRNLSSDSIELINSGRIFSGKKAHEIGLIDALGSKNEALSYLESIGIENPMIYEIESPSSILDILSFKANSVFPTYD